MEGGQVMMGFDDNISKALQVTNRVTPDIVTNRVTDIVTNRVTDIVTNRCFAPVCQFLLQFACSS